MLISHNQEYQKNPLLSHSARQTGSYGPRFAFVIFKSFSLVVTLMVNLHLEDWGLGGTEFFSFYFLWFLDSLWYLFFSPFKNYSPESLLYCLWWRLLMHIVYRVFPRLVKIWNFSGARWLATNWFYGAFLFCVEWSNSYELCCGLFESTIIICVIYYRIFMIVWLFAARCFISGGFQVTFVYTPEVNFIFNTKAKCAHKI